MAAKKTVRQGRPPAEIKPDAKIYKAGLRLRPSTEAKLRAKAEAALRPVGREVTMAVRAYLTAHARLPAVAELDQQRPVLHVQMDAATVRTLDARAGIDARDAYLVAAVEWWIGR